MKKFKQWLTMGLVALTIGASACSGSEDDELVVPEFPTKQTMSVVANGESTYLLTANLDWKLSSNEPWCTLVSAEMEGQNISGKSGSHTIKVRVSNESHGFTESEATLTLTMGTESQVIATVVRPGKAYELIIYDEKGNELKDFTITSEGSLTFVVDANFDCAVTENVAWLDDVVLKDVEGKKTGTLTVKQEQIKNSQNGNIKFNNKEGNAPFNFKVTYEGMDVRAINITSKDVNAANFYNWNVSMDGKTFSKKNDLSGEMNEVKEKMTFNIVARNDEYTPVFVEKSGNTYNFGVTWIHMQQNGETAALTVDAAEKSREGYVLVLPNAVYNEVKENFTANLLEQDTEGNTVVKYAFEQKYFLLSFTQEDNSDTGFTVLRMGYEKIECNPETDADLLAYLQSEYTLESVNIATISVAASTPLTINPNLPVDVFNGSQANACNVCYQDGKDVPWELISDYNFLESGLTEGDKTYYVSMHTPDEFTKLIIVVFRGTDYLNKKALVIRPK